MKILDWRPLDKGTLRGFVDIELEIGLRIHEAPVHRAVSGHCWVALSGKAQVDRDRNTRRNAQTGKLEYARVLTWRDRETGDKFSAAVLKLLLDRDPGALSP